MKKKYILLIFTIIIMLQTKSEDAIFGGGCFWCTEAIFQNIQGVNEVKPGYSGGTTKNPTYREICTGETGHAEVIKIKFNPNEIKFEKLLEVFFLTHDPTSLNKQGADKGTQYRSVVFYTNQNQKDITEKIIKTLTEQKVYDKPVVTEVSPLIEFYPAESYHENYFKQNGNEAYCRYVIQPKMEKFLSVFEDILKK